MDSLRSLLQKRIKVAGIAVQVDAARVTAAFDEVAVEVLGTPAGKKVRALYLKDKTLTVACLSPAIAQELQLNQRRAIQLLNGRFGGEELVKKLRFIT
ncbi:MAG: DUF721 domain-containing protein [Patescibacteria group bacterium]|jgi:predicted nucleic acid-binding Zn ribbon protein